MKNKGFQLIIIIIIVLLVGFVFVAKMFTPIYKTINLEKIDDIDDGLIYIGNIDNDVLEHYKEYKETYSISLYNIDESQLDSVNTILKKYDVEELEEEGYILFSNNVPVWSSAKEIDDSSLVEAIDEFFNGVIPASKIAYKVPTDGDTMVKLIKRKKFTVLVLGKQDCNYCTMYLPVFNKVARNYDIDIYYIDVNNYQSEEYKKVTDLKLDIPEECTTTGIATNTSDSFPKPMTLITYDGETIDCILGYASYSKLESKLDAYGIINADQ